MTNNSLVSTSHTSRGSPLLSASPVGALPADVAAAREEEEQQQQRRRKEEASLPSPLKVGSPPRHVAVIMDGNSRWARARDLPTLAGHVAGYRALKKIVDLSSRWGIRAFTVFAFSSENWRRPKAEVDFLMILLEGVLKESIGDFLKLITIDTKWNLSLGGLLHQNKQLDKSNLNGVPRRKIFPS